MEKVEERKGVCGRNKGRRAGELREERKGGKKGCWSTG
jgi:hypothetical protein